MHFACTSQELTQENDVTHRTTHRRRPALRVAAVTAAGALALAAVPAAGADAAPGDLTVTYDAVGVTHIAKPNNDIPIGPTTLVTTVSATGAITGSLDLPPTKTTFSVLGFIPVSATVTFIPVGKGGGVTGTLKPGKVRTKAKFILRLTDVTVAGIPAGVGTTCQSTTPAIIPIATPVGEKFSIIDGGNLAGTYTIPPFANCGLTTSIINLLIPGPDNTLKITISNGRLAG